MLGPNIVTMDLPFDQDWLPYPDLNILALASHLDAAGRERAMDEAYLQWRESVRPAARITATHSCPLSGLTPTSLTDIVDTR